MYVYLYAMYVCMYVCLVKVCENIRPVAVTYTWTQTTDK